VGNQSVLCPVCQGVMPASGRDAYTTLRGRLIVTNGYCAGGCAERQAAMEQTQQVTRPVAHAAPPAQGVAPVVPLSVARARG
jgi:C4-type Zn-finger protein